MSDEEKIVRLTLKVQELTDEENRWMLLYKETWALYKTEQARAKELEERLRQYEKRNEVKE